MAVPKDTILTPEESVDMLEARLPTLSAHYGCLVKLLGDGRAVERATVTLVEYAGHKFLLTAAHAALAYAEHESVFLGFDQSPIGAAILGRLSKGIRIAFSPSIAFLSRELDVAAFDVPPALAALDGLRWFDLDRSLAGLRVLSERPERWKPGGGLALPLVAFGFGNYGAFEDAAVRRQVVSGGALMCDLRAWDPDEALRPQMILEPWVDADLMRSGDLNEIERTLARRLSCWDDGAFGEEGGSVAAAFGGYSGGPIVLLAAGGDLLVATTKEGTRRPGAARIIATPISATVSALARALAERESQL